MKSHELVTIVIPYYDKKETILRSVRSVVNQTYKNWELYIIDDCSPDILPVDTDWEKYPIHILKNDVNIGAGPTRQRGLEASLGKYVSFLDADDWWSPEFLEKCVRELEGNLLAGAAWVRSAVYQKDGTVVTRRYSEFSFTNIQETILQYARPWQTGGILWRKSECGEWGALTTNEDYLFEFSSSLKNNYILPVSEVLYHIDQITGSHLSERVNKNESMRNSFSLYEYVYHNLRSKLSVKSKILLFHRTIRALLKIAESGENTEIAQYWIRTEKLYLITYMLLRQRVLLKLIHSFLQRTPYKLYF